MVGGENRSTSITDTNLIYFTWAMHHKPRQVNVMIILPVNIALVVDSFLNFFFLVLISSSCLHLYSQQKSLCCEWKRRVGAHNHHTGWPLTCPRPRPSSMCSHSCPSCNNGPRTRGQRGWGSLGMLTSQRPWCLENAVKYWWWEWLIFHTGGCWRCDCWLSMTYWSGQHDVRVAVGAWALLAQYVVRNQTRLCSENKMWLKTIES